MPPIPFNRHRIRNRFAGRSPRNRPLLIVDGMEAPSARASGVRRGAAAVGVVTNSRCVKTARPGTHGRDREPRIKVST